LEGNKRTAIVLVLSYLELNGLKIRVDADFLSNFLADKAVQIAESDPRNKNFVINNIIESLLDN
jgi:prophage maintenance system killer protein